MALFTTALGLYGGVLWSGELQGPILHEMGPSSASASSSAPIMGAPAAAAAPGRAGLRRPTALCGLQARARAALSATERWALGGPSY
jgi:hypothetical protein